MLNKKIAVTVAAAGLAAATLLSACAPKNDETLVNINKGEASIEYGYGNFFANYYKSLYDTTYGSYYGTDFWTKDMSGNGSTMEADVKDSLMDELKSEYLLEQHAADYGVTLSDDDAKAIDDAAAAFLDDNEKKAVKAMGATEEYIKKMLTGMFYSNKVEAAIKAETQVSLTDDETGQSKMSYVCFSTKGKTESTDSTSLSPDLSDEEKAKVKENAEALAAADASEFEDKAKELGGEVKTYTYTTAADSYTDATIPESVIKAAKDLDEGETSDVIEDEDTGYYVVRLDAVHDDDATSSKIEELTASAQSEHYKEVLDGWEADLDWSVDDSLWDKISMTDVTYTMKQTGSGSTDSSTSGSDSTGTTDSSSSESGSTATDGASSTTNATSGN